ncbi:MAG: D-sedoheptulose 7-phosphate isomerase [Proteobacteria bacterium]|nr:D-sedoheptulose 7-phosphate isomerase [Pseudomonadota bacterium]MBU1387437.1 D-sedoheptulose 7-phosphate isomerase [Pseudomonadota bacterium]MBU1541722.1 D-sedoheptulose 7-phosphate isomerase [Pseudomonadota bacterium]MBU2431284.1 D-sedoheptulose 7-phosphate isomerase [Pseudomonadota bacterium]MBU2479660.1 D-sedoheptulose 7-phosphate isomerase [Pseudomonadota bacterium]
MKHIIKKCVEDSIRTKQIFFEQNIERIESCAVLMARTFEQGKKILLFGNGGSAADCQHIAAEFINRFQMERRPLPGLALTTDTSVITSIGNDYSYEDIFLKQIQALGQKGDIALGISTSGNSPNVVKAMIQAKQMGLVTLGLSGNKGKLKDISDIAFCVDCDTTARIQEVHILLAHILCDLTERILFDDTSKS